MAARQITRTCAGPGEGPVLGAFVVHFADGTRLAFACDQDLGLCVRGRDGRYQVPTGREGAILASTPAGRAWCALMGRLMAGGRA